MKREEVGRDETKIKRTRGSKRGEEDTRRREMSAGEDERLVKRRRESERDGDEDDNCFTMGEKMYGRGFVWESVWLDVHVCDARAKCVL